VNLPRPVLSFLVGLGEGRLGRGQVPVCGPCTWATAEASSGAGRNVLGDMCSLK